MTSLFRSAEVDLGAQCSCGCRTEDAEGPGCPCPECQPGPGLNFVVRRKHVLRTARIQALLAKGTLSPEEDRELEALASTSMYWDSTRWRR